MKKEKSQLNDNLHWYKDAIIYELHIKAFRDGNGDGIGDFEGLMEKLDYLVELGVTAIWILPFYPSPQKDDGYDISDYYNINESYGNIREFKNLLKEAHHRKLKVITELVINHTSDQHPWFKRARRAAKGSSERDFYVWTDNPDKYKEVRIIFQDFERSNWTWDEEAQQYYWHRFFHHQPDLNFENLAVQQEVFKIIDYWCKLGVDGFRLDAVPYLFEQEGTNCENLPQTHRFLKKLRKHADQNYPGTLLLAEANMWPEDSAAYFGNGDECQMNYHFPIMPRMFMALRMEDRFPITDIFDQTPAIPETCQWAIFLRNHDELTLEMVTDEERDYMYKVYAKDPRAKINLGIRHRLAPLVENNRLKIELLNHLLLSLPGTPVIYYGDEIGMGDNFYLGDRNGVRTPMQWSPDRNAGFSETNPQQLYLPVILDPEYHYESVNVEIQHHKPSSLLWFMKHAIAMRKKYKAFGRGDLKFIDVDNPKILAFTRSYNDEIILVIVNLSRFTQAAELDLSKYKGYIPIEIFSKNHFPAIREKRPYFFTLSPHAHHWLLLQQAEQKTEKEASLPVLKLEKWSDFSNHDKIKEMETVILPQHLANAKWFEGRRRTVENVRIINSINIPLEQGSAFILLLEVNYESDLPEKYQLSVTNVKITFGQKLLDSNPQAVMALVKTGQTDSYLCDALFTSEYRQEIFARLAKRQDLHAQKGTIQFFGGVEIKKYFREHPQMKSKVLSAEKNYTSVNYENKFYLKFYRKVELGINPDTEITAFLTEHTDFDHIPPLVGFIQWKTDNDSIMLGMIQVMVENHGDGWMNILERLNNFNERILSRNKANLPPPEYNGKIFDTINFDSQSEELKEFFSGITADQIHSLGKRTGEMHKALASVNDLHDFRPETFSLHYQRSLFAGYQSLVREVFTNQGKNLKKLSAEDRLKADRILSRKNEVMNIFKGIYTKKLDLVKIRIHGNLDLSQILLTGKDLMIRGFGGDPSKNFSQRRIKRAALRDVAQMISSFHYAAYAGLIRNNQIRKEDYNKLIPYARWWTHYVSGFYLHSYIDTVRGDAFIPKEKEDIERMLKIFLLEKALDSFNYEMNNRPDWVKVPIGIIELILD
ncbi:MAG: maltose alpha-D-glucosyltransferase [Chitinophagales bacterium]